MSPAKIIYNTAIRLYLLGIRAAAPFSRKARLWMAGRKAFFSRWKEFDAGGRRVAWFHCASLGEFEQGRPVIEEIRKRDRDAFILLTFFSPSGYEVRKDYPQADAVCYLPADTPSNARKFAELFNPSVAVFVKYEFWYNYICEMYRRQTPLYLVSANFRPGQVFFRWYGRWFARMLKMFTRIFVQTEESKTLLNSVGISDVTVAGDTRFDRVYEIVRSAPGIGKTAGFSNGSFTVVAGSTWPPDHDLWVRYMNETDHDIKLIIAPHEIDNTEIDRLAKRFSAPAVRFSEFTETGTGRARVMIIDNIGMLSSLYRYGRFAYIGGGFGRNIHNILEACAYGIPVVFGPRYRDFREAVDLARLGGAFPVTGFVSFAMRVDQLIVDRQLLERSGQIAGEYVRSETGATAIIVDKLTCRGL